MVGVALSAGLVWRSERFRLSGAYVVGNSRVPAESVYAASGLAGRHAFAVRRHQAASRIESLPDVSEAKVKIMLPNRVVITVWETEPQLIWDTEAGRMAIDENSYSVFPPADAAGLVHVTDEVGLIASTGQRLPAHLLDAALAYGKHFERLIYRRDVGFVAHTDAGLEVRLGKDGHEVERQMKTLAAMEAQLAKERGPVAYVDVRFVDHPYFRLLQGAD
jgi:cell division septal protein FtsQ